jgi:hypothetical protein
LEEQKIKESIEAIYENIDVKRKAALMYTVIFLMRRLLYALTLVLLGDYPLFQLFIMQTLVVSNAIYLVSVKPYETKLSNYSEIFNEICILTCTNFLYIYTDYNTDVDLSFDTGFVIIGVVGLNIIVNVTLMVTTSCALLRMQILKLRFKYRMWRYKR